VAISPIDARKPKGETTVVVPATPSTSPTPSQLPTPPQTAK